MTNFRKAVLNLINSNVPDYVVKELLREMVCPNYENTDCDGVDSRFFSQPIRFAEVPARSTWIS